MKITFRNLVLTLLVFVTAFSLVAAAYNVPWATIESTHANYSTMMTFTLSDTCTTVTASSGSVRICQDSSKKISLGCAGAAIWVARAALIGSCVFSFFAAAAVAAHCLDGDKHPNLQQKTPLLYRIWKNAQLFTLCSTSVGFIFELLYFNIVFPSAGTRCHAVSAANGATIGPSPILVGVAWFLLLCAAVPAKEGQSPLERGRIDEQDEEQRRAGQNQRVAFEHELTTTLMPHNSNSSSSGSGGGGSESTVNITDRYSDSD